MFSKPYHSANLKHQPYPQWKVIALAWVAKALAIQFKIDGIPYGAPYHYRSDFTDQVNSSSEKGAVIGGGSTYPIPNSSADIKGRL